MILKDRMRSAKITNLNPLVFELVYGPYDGQIGFRGDTGMFLMGVVYTHFDSGVSFKKCLAMPGYINLSFKNKVLSYQYKGNLRYEFAEYMS